MSGYFTSVVSASAFAWRGAALAAPVQRSSYRHGAAALSAVAGVLRGLRRVRWRSAWRWRHNQLLQCAAHHFATSQQFQSFNSNNNSVMFCCVVGVADGVGQLQLINHWRAVSGYMDIWPGVNTLSTLLSTIYGVVASTIVGVGRRRHFSHWHRSALALLFASINTRIGAGIGLWLCVALAGVGAISTSILNQYSMRHGEPALRYRVGVYGHGGYGNQQSIFSQSYSNIQQYNYYSNNHI